MHHCDYSANPCLFPVANRVTPYQFTIVDVIQSVVTQQHSPLVRVFILVLEQPESFVIVLTVCVVDQYHSVLVQALPGYSYGIYPASAVDYEQVVFLPPP
jgi:hypothetical protein